jgi:hypothetical protein
LSSTKQYHVVAKKFCHTASCKRSKQKALGLRQSTPGSVTVLALLEAVPELRGEPDLGAINQGVAIFLLK